MNKICTTIEQSQKLIELGIDVNTADMHWMNEIIFLSFDKVDKAFNDKMGCEYLPAWSLAALLAVFPKIGANEPKLCKRYYVDAPIVRYVCTYGLLKETKEYCNPVDACYEIIVWLKENGKL